MKQYKFGGAMSEAEMVAELMGMYQESAGYWEADARRFAMRNKKTYREQIDRHKRILY